MIGSDSMNHGCLPIWPIFDLLGSFFSILYDCLSYGECDFLIQMMGHMPCITGLFSILPIFGLYLTF